MVINDDGNEEELTKSFVDGYKTRPLCMEGISLIDAARSWLYNPKRRGDNKWSPRNKAVIVRVFPRYFTIPPRDSDKWVDFCLSKLILYKPFRNVERDIGRDDDTIVENWDSLNYNPWHVRRQEHAQNNERSSDSEIEENGAI